MLGSDAPVLVGSLVVVAVAVLTVVVSVGLMVRAGRRRLRSLRRHTVVRSAAALWSLTRPGLLSTGRLRHELWQGVGSAERSVRAATAAGGAVGDLPSLCRRLHDVALDLDRLLTMGDGLAPGLPELDRARRHAAAVVTASASIRRAAIAAAGDAAGTRVRALVEDADREVHALAAGLARANAAFPPVG